MKVYDLVFNDCDLCELQDFLSVLFADNSFFFERLVSALSRLGLSVVLTSSLDVRPSVEVSKQKVVDILEKGLTHVQKKEDKQAR